MEAVKVPSTSQVKSQMRTVSADASKGGDEFKKLLQVKNDQVQKEPVKKEQTQPQNADVKKKGSENSGGLAHEFKGGEGSGGRKLCRTSRLKGWLNGGARRNSGL